MPKESLPTEEEIEMPKESLSDCAPSSVKKNKHIAGLVRIYDDSSNNTFLRVTNVSDPSKGERVYCMNEHPNFLMRTTFTILKAWQLV
ncbi:unnamed protein product [Lathyrus sativus]|nr:unnamed protein product [Lathyrus sativus]